MLPSSARARVAAEASYRTGWEHYVGLDGVIVGLDRFGTSAPGEVPFKKFGFTADNVAAQARQLLQ